MTAQSVTGIGLGHARNNKGSEHMHLGTEKLVGPRVVAADAATLNGSGNAVIKLPLLSGTAANYIVSVTDADTTAASACAASLILDGTSTTVTLKGPASGAVQYSIIKRGLAL